MDELKKKLVTASHILDRKGILDEHGHFSVRVPEKGGVLMNGKMSPGQTTVDDLILVDMQGNLLEGTVEPASETPLHLAVYEKRPDVMAMVHSHSPMIVTLSVAGVPLRTVENQGACVIGKGVPVFEKYGLINSFDLAYEVAETLADHKMCVLKSHGNIVVGGDIEEACILTMWAERAALRQFNAMQIGEPHWYPEDELEKMRKQEYEAKGHLKTWRYYEWQVNQKS